MNWPKIGRWFLCIFMVSCLGGATLAGVFMLTVEHHRGAASIFQNFLQPLGAGILSLMFVYRELFDKSVNSINANATAVSESTAQAAANPQQSVQNIFNVPTAPAPIINLDERFIQERIDSVLRRSRDLTEGNIEAKSFTLTDSQGRRRAVLSSDQSGPFLAFLDEEGKTDLVLEGGRKAPFFALLKGGNIRLSVGLAENNGLAAIGLLDQNLKSRIALAFGLDGTPAVYLADAKGSPRCALALNATGAPVLGLRGTDGKFRLSIALEQDGKPSIRMYDSEGKLESAYQETGQGIVSLSFVQSGITRAALINSAQGPLIVLWDETGKIVWSQSAITKPNPSS
jgi:hypothetical protein